MLGVRHAILDHGVVIVDQRVFAEAAPSARVTRLGVLENQAADGALADPEVAHPGAHGLDDACRFVPQHQRVALDPGEMPVHQLPVGGVAQAGHLGPHQRLVPPRLGLAQVDDPHLARLGNYYGSHRVNPASSSYTSTSERYACSKIGMSFRYTSWLWGLGVAVLSTRTKR